MGDLQTEQGESLELRFVPVSEFERLRAAPVSPGDRVRAFAALARINALQMIEGAWSGHIGTSFSSLEIMSWLFLNELRDLDKGDEACDIFFSSKGHDAPALYSVLIGLGLLPPDSLSKLRELHGLPGHPHVETPYVQANTGSLGMGISKAKGMAIANRLTGRTRKIFVLTGDGELQEGQFWESLGSAVTFGLGEITAIIDHNKIQSDTWVEKVSPLGDLKAKLEKFGWYVARCDGHDVEALERVFREFDGVPDRPKVLIADTVKGRGVSFWEGSDGFGEVKPDEKARSSKLYLYHSGARPEQDYLAGMQELLATANARFAELGLGALATETRTRKPRREPRQTDNLIDAYERALVALGERRPDVLVLDADLIRDCGLVSFAKRFKERFIECGIAEQDMVSMAGGMARRGALPIVHSFACFLAARPNEQIYNQASESSKVIYVASLAGLLPGGPGHSHQSVRDISALAAVPGLVMAEPSAAAEVPVLLDALVDGPGSGYLRLISPKWELPFAYPEGHRPEIGKGWTAREGAEGVIFAYGTWPVSNACHAAVAVEAATGARLAVVVLPWLNRVDDTWLRDAIGARRVVITLDNHYVNGGQGDMIAAAIARLSLQPSPSVTRLGVTKLPECGSNDDVLKDHGLDVESLAQRFRAAFEASIAPPEAGPADTVPARRSPLGSEAQPR